MLELWGHRVRTAVAGADGVDRVMTEPFDVAIVALDLPDDGYDVARRIRATAGGKQIRLLAVTADGRPEDVRRAREMGFDAELVMPVSPEQLSRILADVAGGLPPGG
jgi:CheY-like chemotaxis protein